MPIYEYEANEWACAICNGRFEALQAINDEPLEFCPTCGQQVVKVISRAQIKISKFQGHDHSGGKGFTTYKKSEEGVWEKIAGEGVDAIVSSEEDKKAISQEKADAASKPAKVIDLDAT